MANPIWLLTLIGSQPPQPILSDSHVQVLVGDLDGRLLTELTCKVGPVAWRLRGTSRTTLEIGTTDTKAIEKYIQIGKRVLFKFANGLPEWGGLIDAPIKWTNKGAIQFAAYSIDYLLSYRQTDRERSFHGMPAGLIIEELLNDANGLDPTGITIGDMWKGGDGYTLSYNYDDLFKVIDRDLTNPGLSASDFWIEAKEDDGYIVFTANFAERRGVDRPEVAYIEGHNIGNADLTYRGPIVNAWTILGAGGDGNWAIGYAEDEDSIGQYGLRQANEDHTDIGIEAQLNAIASNMVARTAQPYRILTLEVVDKAPGLFAAYDVGDRVRVILENFGHGGYDEMVRVHAREFNPMTGRCRLVVWED